MKNLFILLLFVFVFGCQRQAATETETAAEETTDSPAISEGHEEEVVAHMQGIWTSSDDGKSVVEVTGNQWISKYPGTKDDQYIITITDSIAGSSEKGDFLLLTNATDTMQYGIDEVTPETLRLIYLARGNSLSYIKNK